MKEELKCETTNQQEPNQKIFNFLFPTSRYLGYCTPENLIFDANLQEFSQKVSYISALGTGGKLSPQEAYEQIDRLWQQLETLKENLLGVGND
jgi:hypothetical protein